MGTREKEISRRRNRQSTPADGGVSTRDPSSVRDAIESFEVEQPVEKSESQGVTAVVVDNGQFYEVKAFFVLLRHPMFLITMEHGQHETTRVFVKEDGQVFVGDRAGNKLGPSRVTGVTFDTRTGLTVFTTHGTMFSPIHDCQATWIPADREANR